MYKRLHLLLSHSFGAWREKKQRFAEWFWLLLSYFVSQAAIQALNFVSGIIILRSLPKDDYALYTIINTMGPTMTMLSDIGITFGLVSVGRKIWQDNEKMGRLVQTGLKLRRSFGLISFVVVAPILGWMLARHHAGVGTILLLIVVVTTASWIQLTGGVMRVVIELRQQVAVLRNAGLLASVLRLGLVAVLAKLFFINAWLASLTATCGVSLEVFLLTRAVRPQIAHDVAEDAEYRSSIYTMVRKTAPLTIYFCIQSQVSIWLISIFGKTQQVADIGAVGRIGMIFAVLGSVYAAIAVPRFARSNGRTNLLLRFFQITGSHGGIVFLLTCLAWSFPAPLLFILGPKYAGLSNLIWLVVLSSGLSSFLGLIWGLSTGRGWVVPATISIPLEILTQIVLLLSLDLSKSENVMIFSCLSVIPPILVNFIFMLRIIGQQEE